MTNCPLRDGPRVLYGNVEDSRADIKGWAPREVPTSGARGINWPLRDVYRCTYNVYGTTVTQPSVGGKRSLEQTGTDESLVLQVRKGCAQRGKQRSSKKATPAVGVVTWSCANVGQRNPPLMDTWTHVWAHRSEKNIRAQRRLD